MPTPRSRLCAMLLAALPAAAPAAAADSKLQTPHRVWRTLDPVALTAPDPILFPAGTLVRERFVDFGDIRPCLPDQPEVGERLRFRRLNCLADRDGDGRYETVERLSSMVGAHVPIVRLLGVVALPAPLRLEALPGRSAE